MPSKVPKFPWRECEKCHYGYYPEVENPKKCVNCQYRPRIYYGPLADSKEKVE